MTKTPIDDGPSGRSRSARHVYDQAVRATLQSGDQEEARQLLEGVKRLRSEYGDIDVLIEKLETALGAAR
jgi:hypothetical protein